MAKNQYIGNGKRKYIFKRTRQLMQSQKDEYWLSGIIDRKMTQVWREDRLSASAKLFLSIGLTYPDFKTWEITDEYWYVEIGNYITNILNELYQKGYVEIDKVTNTIIVNIMKDDVYKELIESRNRKVAEDWEDA